MGQRTIPSAFLSLRKKDMKLKELCTDERPREKMIEKGASSLSNAELLAIMLRILKILILIAKIVPCSFK